MPTDGVDDFLRAEEEANRLVDELARLKHETESYKTARDALDGAAEGVSGLATKLGGLAGRLGDVVEALRSIGTPELLGRLEAVASDIATIRQDLGNTQRSIVKAHQQDIKTLKDALSAQFLSTGTTLRVVRNVAIGNVALMVMALALLGWMALTLVSG